MSWWEIFLLVLLLVAFGVAIAMLILAVRNWQGREWDSSSSSWDNGSGGYRKPLIPSFAYIYSTGAATGLTGTVPLTLQSPLTTTRSLIFTGISGNQLYANKYGAGRYRVDFSLTVETGSVGPIKVDVFVDNTAISSVQYGLPATSNAGTISGFGIVLLEAGSVVDLRVTSGTVILGAGKTNASLMLQRISNFTNSCAPC